jgi:hypothetical protein
VERQLPWAVITRIGGTILPQAALTVHRTLAIGRPRELSPLATHSNHRQGTSKYKRCIFRASFVPDVCAAWWQLEGTGGRPRPQGGRGKKKGKGKGKKKKGGKAKGKSRGGKGGARADARAVSQGEAQGGGEGQEGDDGEEEEEEEEGEEEAQMGMGGGEAAQDLQGAAQEEEEEDMCPICVIFPLSLGETCRGFQCEHVLHSGCLADWQSWCAGDEQTGRAPRLFDCPTCRALSVAVAQGGGGL